MCIDNGMIKKREVNQDQCLFKDWESDIILLIMYYSVKVGKILLVEGHKYKTTQLDLCLLLLLM